MTSHQQCTRSWNKSNSWESKLRNDSILLTRGSPGWKNPLTEVAIASLEVDIVVSIAGGEDLPETSNGETTHAARIIATTIVTSLIGDVAVVVAVVHIRVVVVAPQQRVLKTTHALGKTKPRARIKQTTTSVRMAQTVAQTLTQAIIENDCIFIISTLTRQRKHPMMPQPVCAKTKIENPKNQKNQKNLINQVQVMC